MGKRTSRTHRSHTLPSSPTHHFSSSSSSSEFEFTISISPRKSSTALCPADELFYKGQLLPLHLSPRLSMVRNLLSSSSTSSDSTATASRDSSGSSTDSHSSFTSDLLLPLDCDSSRPSSAAEDHEYPSDFKRPGHTKRSSTKYFSLSRFSNVFRKEANKARPDQDNPPGSSSSVKRMSVTAKEVIRKYLKKVKPLYEKLSQKQQQKVAAAMTLGSRTISSSSANVSLFVKSDGSAIAKDNGGGDLLLSASVKDARKDRDGAVSHSFSGNLRYPRKRSNIISSCPSSMRSSPSHSGLLTPNGSIRSSSTGCTSSSMEELHSAIQGAIAHCKNSMVQGKGLVSNDEI